jgi:hypothetical protein
MNELLKILLDVKFVLDKHNVVFWLDHGTLLGIIRMGGFILWEHDIDLGSWKNNTDKWDVIVSDLKNMGYSVLNAGTHINIHSDTVWLDIGLFQSHDGLATVDVMIPVNAVGDYLLKLRKVLLSPNHYEYSVNQSKIKHYILNIVNPCCNLIPLKLRILIATFIEKLMYIIGCKTWGIPEHFYQSFQSLYFMGELYKVPLNPEAYLEFRYGKDWRIPKYNWKTTDGGGVIWKRKH